MQSSPFSPPFDDLIAANGKLVPDIRYAEILPSGETYVIGVGDGYQCKEIPLPAEEPFNAAIKRIVDSGFAGRVLFAPFAFHGGQIAMLVQPIEASTTFLAHIRQTPADVDGVFRLMAFGMASEAVIHGDQSTLLRQLVKAVKATRDTLVESALRFSVSPSGGKSIHLLPDGGSVLLDGRPYLRQCVEACLKAVAASDSAEAILFCVKGEKGSAVYCFTDLHVIEAARQQLTTSDEMVLRLTVQIRSGRDNLDLKPLAADLSSAMGVQVTSHPNQILSITKTTALADSQDLSAMAERCLRDLACLSLHDQLGFYGGWGLTPEIRGYLSGHAGECPSSPPLSAESRALIAEVHQGGIPELALRLLEGLSQSYTSYRPRDALIALWAAVEDSLFSESERTRLFPRATVNQVKDCLNKHSSLDPASIDTLCDRVSELKTPTRNEVIYTKMAAHTGRSYTEVKAAIKSVFNARGAAAHTQVRGDDNVETALAVLREYVSTVVKKLLGEEKASG